MSQSVVVLTPDELRQVVLDAMKDALKDTFREMPHHHNHEMDTLRCKEYLTTEEVAKFFSLNSDSLNSQRARRQGPPFVKVGTKVLYRRQAVQDYLEAHRVRIGG